VVEKGFRGFEPKVGGIKQHLERIFEDCLYMGSLLVGTESLTERSLRRTDLIQVRIEVGIQAKLILGFSGGEVGRLTLVSRCESNTCLTA